MAETDRGLAPVVGKSLELGLLVLYVALLTTTLYAGVVPDYRTAAADEVNDRTLARAGDAVERSVPPPATAVEREVRIDLPETIRGANYRIRAATNATLVLDHPERELTERTRLSLPDRVVAVDGVWRSGGRTLVVVRGGQRELSIALETREG